MIDRQTKNSTTSFKASSRTKWWIVGLILIIIAGVVCKKFISNSPSQTAPVPMGKKGIGIFNDIVPVKIETVKKGQFVVYLNALGTVTAYNTVNVVSRVQGELVQVLFTEGQQVKAGDLLAIIDPRPFEAALLQAQGTEEQNKALLQNARSELTRYEQLIKQDSIAKQTYESQVALVNQYEGTLLASQAQVKDAQLNLEFSQIKAPISGRLGIRQIDIGNYIRVGDTTPLVSITQTQPISATFTLPESQLPSVAAKLQQGNTLIVEAWDSTNSQLLATGQVETLDNQIDTNTGTILVKAKFANDQNMLFPNQFINIKLKLTTLAEQLIIPTDSVQYGTKGTFVYVVKDNKVHLRYIKLGQSNAEKTVVANGLTVNEKVVLEGTDRLRENAQVEIINPQDSPIEKRSTSEK